MQICIFDNLISSLPRATTLLEVALDIRESWRLRDATMEYRTTKKESEPKIIKQMMLPAFSPNVWFHGGKSRSNVRYLTGLCFLDIDHVEPERIDEVMQILSKDEHVALAYRSVSGQGIHIFVRYAFSGIDLFAKANRKPEQMRLWYKNVFQSISDMYQQLLGMSIDQSGENMEQLSLVSFDANVLYNHNATPIVFMDAIGF